MARSETFVIVGAGLAGAKSAEALRAKGFRGRLILLGNEWHRPYERPPLSKGYLAATIEREKLFVHPEHWYSDHDVELRLGQTVTGLDREARRIHLSEAESISYDKLVLATGSSARRLAVPGGDANGVYYLRTMDDAQELRDLLATAARLVVIGAGWIGLEVSAAARQAGVQVSVVETAELPLLGVLGSEVASVFAQLHRQHGVDFHFNASLAEIRADGGRATGVRLGDGTVIEADAVLVAVGASPNTAIAEAAGLEVDNGVVVDAGLRTADPDVFAVGDVASAQHPFFGRQIRVEHWANALNQPDTVATSMLGGQASYAELPYFFTDQYDLGMEYVGFVEPGREHQVVFRGDVAAREFIAFWIADGRVQAGMNVNVWDVTDQIKALIHSGSAIDADRLADLADSLADLAAGIGAPLSGLVRDYQPQKQRQSEP